MAGGINWYRTINLEVVLTYFKIPFWNLGVGTEYSLTNIRQGSRSFSRYLDWEPLECKTRYTKNCSCFKLNMMKMWRDVLAAHKTVPKCTFTLQWFVFEFVCGSAAQCVDLLTERYANIVHSSTELDQHYGFNSWTKPFARITAVPSVFWTEVPGRCCTSVYMHTHLAAPRFGLYVFISNIQVFFL
jgi:hypothetical protein